VGLVALALVGAIPAKGDGRWRVAFDWMRDLGLEGLSARDLSPVVPGQVEDAPPRPPPAEVADLWYASDPVDCDDEVAAWLNTRGLDPALIADRDLARAVRRGSALPRWARCCGRSWGSRYRLIMPAWDELGRLSSLRARFVGEPPAGLPKAAAAACGPGSAKGLVLADGGAQQMLAAGVAPSWWPLQGPFRLVIAEGETDFLTLATRWSSQTDSPTVMGIWAGAWTQEIADRVPSAAEVVVATDPGPDGDRYAASVTATLIGRCAVRRFRGGPDGR